MVKRFRILRIVATIWKVLAWIVLVASVLGACGSLAIGLMASGTSARGSDAFGLGTIAGPLGGLVTAGIAIFFGVLYFVFLYAGAEGIDVLLALEENTRATAERLKSLDKT